MGGMQPLWWWMDYFFCVFPINWCGGRHGLCMPTMLKNPCCRWEAKQQRGTIGYLSLDQMSLPSLGPHSADVILASTTVKIETIIWKFLKQADIAFNVVLDLVQDRTFIRKTEQMILENIYSGLGLKMNKNCSYLRGKTATWNYWVFIPWSNELAFLGAPLPCCYSRFNHCKNGNDYWEVLETGRHYIQCRT